MDSDKVDAVTYWLELCSVRGVHDFLVLAGYYRTFISDFGMVATALRCLLRKKAFTWTPEVAEAFMALKCAFSIESVLQMPNFEWQFSIDWADPCPSATCSQPTTN